MKIILPVMLALLLTVPAAAKVFEISIDIDRGVAYIPIGTALPYGMTVHAGVVSGIDLMDEPLIGSRSRLLRPRKRAHDVKSAPLRIEFADESRFVALRAHFGRELDEKKSRFSARTHSQVCFDIYYEATVDTWYTGYFKSTFCRDDPGPSVGQYGTWTFGSQAWGGADAQAYVDDSNGNYLCWQSAVGYGSASCSDSAYTQLHSSCRNDVNTWGATTHWVYLSEYEIEYHIVTAGIDYCTYFD